MTQAVNSSGQMRIFMLTFCTTFVLWLLLVGNFGSQEMIAGVVVCAVISLLTLNYTSILGGIRIHLFAPISFVLYLFVFIKALIVANLDMARRVLSPSLPIRPEVVRVSTNLHSDLGKLILANSITLTPGTLTVDVKHNQLVIHWIDCPPNKDIQAATKEIAASFERHIKGFAL